MLFPTTIVGSFPQPEWLIDRARLAGRFSGSPGMSVDDFGDGHR